MVEVCEHMATLLWVEYERKEPCLITIDFLCEVRWPPWVSSLFTSRCQEVMFSGPLACPASMVMPTMGMAGIRTFTVGESLPGSNGG